VSFGVGVDGVGKIGKVEKVEKIEEVEEFVEVEEKSSGKGRVCVGVKDSGSGEVKGGEGEGENLFSFEANIPVSGKVMDTPSKNVEEVAPKFASSDRRLDSVKVVEKSPANFFGGPKVSIGSKQKFKMDSSCVTFGVRSKQESIAEKLDPEKLKVPTKNFLQVSQQKISENTSQPGQILKNSQKDAKPLVQLKTPVPDSLKPQPEIKSPEQPKAKPDDL
jgi:hypothetical protein